MGLAALKNWGEEDDKPQALTVRKTALPVKNSVGTVMLPARTRKESSEITADQRLKRDERWLYCKMVIDLQTQTRWKQEKCCQEIARAEALRFPRLLHGGKGGKSQLTYNNCRAWLGKLGKVRTTDGDGYNWDNRNALVDNYVSGIQAAKGPDEFWQLFRGFYLNQNKLSVEESYRLASTRIREKNAFAAVPTISQTRYRVKQLPAMVTALARYGEEYVKNNIVGYIHRDWSEVRANEIWISDHRQFDCAIKVKDADGNWRATRPWLCGFMDAKSWYFTSWQIQEDSPNNETIRNGLAWGISRHGRPGYLYTDNGKDFKAQGFSEPVEFEGHEHSVLKSLGVKVITSLPYNGRAKTIERGFRYHAEAFDKYFASYLGNKPGARPDANAYYWKHPEVLPTLEQFCQAFQLWLELYHDTANKGEILHGQTPRTAFSEGEHYYSAPLASEELFAAFLMPLSSLRTVGRGFAVSVDKVCYYGECLMRHFGEKVMIKTDAQDPSHIFVFTPDGRPIGECGTRAKCKALALTEADRKRVSDQMKEHRQQLKAGYTMLNEATGGLHLLSVQELLQLPEDFDIVKVGSMKSVKGAAHEFIHYKAVGKNAGETAALPVGKDADDVGKRIEFREDVKEAEQRAFEAKFDAMMVKKKEDEAGGEEEFKAFDF